jgi:hypothetical protein
MMKNRDQYMSFATKTKQNETDQRPISQIKGLIDLVPSVRISIKLEFRIGGAGNIDDLNRGPQLTNYLHRLSVSDIENSAERLVTLHQPPKAEIKRHRIQSAGQPQTKAQIVDWYLSDKLFRKPHTQLRG